MDWSQWEAAGHFGVSLFNYKLAEYDHPRAKNFPYKSDINITPRDYEKCLIYRKRANMTQREVADKIGIERYWLLLQETGKVPCDKLLNYWEHGIKN